MLKMAATAVSSVFRPALFRGKTAIVTGGGTGIGKAITRELLFLGCNVMIASRKVDRLIAAVEEIKPEISAENNAQLEYLECNIRKEEHVQNLVSTTLSKFGKIDFLVNNAGGQFPSAAESITLKGWNAVIDTNLTGTFLCCKEVFNQWMQDNGGVIVNIIADMWKGFPGMSHTGAARAAVDNITKTFAIEWAPAGVRINAVAPGSSIFSETARQNYAGSSADNIFLIQVPRIPAKRLGTTEEISAAVCFLLSPAAAFISGETLKVDGAQSLYTTSGMWEVPDHDRIPAYTWEEDAKEIEKQDSNTKSSKSKL